MWRVVLDTNILVSALLTPRGKAAEIITLASSGRFKAYYSAEMLAEYEEVLSRPRFNFGQTDREGLLGGLKYFGVLVEPTVSEIALPDESDRVFYDTALTANALLLTGNLKHYPQEEFIMSPADFLARLQ